MKCILHIGMHKTGTTAIQSALDGYDDGYSFVANLGFKNHSAPIRAAFSKRKLDRYTLEAIHRTGSVLPVYKREILSKLDAQASRKDRSQIIISGEEISHLRNDEKKYFIKYLQNHCKKVSAIIYVRDPLSYAASAFQQRVNGGMTAIPKDIDPHYRFRIETFQNQLGKQNVNVREYQKNKLHKSDVVLDFCNQLNLDPTLCTGESRLGFDLI